MHAVWLLNVFVCAAVAFVFFQYSARLRPAITSGLFFLLGFLVVLGVLALVALVVGRLRAGRWRISRRTALTHSSMR